MVWAGVLSAVDRREREPDDELPPEETRLSLDLLITLDRHLQDRWYRPATSAHRTLFGLQGCLADVQETLRRNENRIIGERLLDRHEIAAHHGRLDQLRTELNRRTVRNDALRRVRTLLQGMLTRQLSRYLDACFRRAV